MQNLDRPLFFAFAILLALGLAALFSASAPVAGEVVGDPFYYLRHQLLWAGLGIAAGALLVQVDCHRWEAAAVPLYFLCLLLLVLVLVPGFGVESHGAQRWLRLGPLQFQPAEAAKLVVVLLLARTLSRRPERLERFWDGLFPQLCLVGAVAALVAAERDLGNVLVIGALALVMLFLAGARLAHLAAVVAAALPWVAWKVFEEAYRLERVFAFLDPWADPYGSGWQVIQSLVAIGSGGLFGVGLGAGVQKRSYLPEPQTDFIFAVVGEELGLAGTLLVVTLFLFVAWRGVRVALRAPTPFARLLAAGLTTLVTLQALLNMMVCTSLVPTKGLPLPFFSAGGSALVVDLAAAGLILACSRWASR